MSTSVFSRNKLTPFAISYLFLYDKVYCGGSFNSIKKSNQMFKNYINKNLFINIVVKSHNVCSFKVSQKIKYIRYLHLNVYSNTILVIQKLKKLVF